MLALLSLQVAFTGQNCDDGKVGQLHMAVTTMHTSDVEIWTTERDEYVYSPIMNLRTDCAYHPVLRISGFLRGEILRHPGLARFRCCSFGANVGQDAVRVGSQFGSRVVRKYCTVNIDQYRDRL